MTDSCIRDLLSMFDCIVGERIITQVRLMSGDCFVPPVMEVKCHLTAFRF